MIRRPNLASRLGRWLLGLTIAGLAIGGFLASAARAQEVGWRESAGQAGLVPAFQKTQADWPGWNVQVELLP
jgi:hypothetical protein